jgi:hypothetical protein
VKHSLDDYYRILISALPSVSLVEGGLPEEAGFFQFGEKNLCYGRCQSGVTSNLADSVKYDASKWVNSDKGTVQLPFDFSEVVDNLRLERYRERISPGLEVFAASQAVRRIYYFFRAGLPVSLRRHLQKAYFRGWKNLSFPLWPVDFTVDSLHETFLHLLMEAGGVKRVPFIWFWPNGAPNCLMMTHDVETAAGVDFTPTLIDLDSKYGIKSSFQVIPEQRYTVSDDYVLEIRRRGCEFNVHDLNHDGHLYREREEFIRRAARINGYVHRYDCSGFRAGAMYRNQEWYDLFEFSYDMSVPNVAHLEPMRGGCCTVFPYFVGKIVELPLTAAQDYSLFHIFNDYSIDLWKRQLALLSQRNGLMSFICHPDYLIEQRARKVYESLLIYLRQMIDNEKVWLALPGEVDSWWRARRQMTLVPEGDGWRIAGPESGRARLAYAVLDGGKVRYELAAVSPPGNSTH